jgi:ABC-type polar amino acid transport system, ATPase component
MQPRIMSFDEPTSTLAPETVGEGLDGMRELRSDGMTMLMVTHEMGFAREVADRVAYMDQGAVVEIGAPATSSTNRSTRTSAFLSRALRH